VLDDYAGMKDGDGLFFVNFRADRAREILQAIGDPVFAPFDVSARPRLAARLGMVDYSTAHDAYMTTVFPKQKIENTLGAWVAKQGLPSSGWPRRRSTRTSPSSSTAARRSRSRARTDSCRPRPRSRPTTSSPR
jgi:hypothetical protein